jgi:hypothetical protein
MKNRQSKISCLGGIPDNHISGAGTPKRKVLKNEARPDLLDKASKKTLEEKLKLESALVRQESLNVLKEFETI